MNLADVCGLRNTSRHIRAEGLAFGGEPVRLTAWLTVLCRRLETRCRPGFPASGWRTRNP